MNVTLANKYEEVAQAHSKIAQIENSKKGPNYEKLNNEDLSHEKE